MPSATASTRDTAVPLCVDLDGTLIRSDVLWESLAQLIKSNPLYLFALPFWILRGRAHFKQQIARRVEIDASGLPYHQPFLEFLRAEKEKGRMLVLATAADQRLADRVAAHVGLFDHVLASDGRNNLRGRNKGGKLAELYGARGFDYAGNSTVDLPVWREARHAIVVNASRSVTGKAHELDQSAEVFNEPRSPARAIINAMRPHQWVKNFIIFVPLLTAHKMADPQKLSPALFAFVAFSLCASGVYVLNDILDLAADRNHPTKRFRPFASGELPLPIGFGMVFGLLGAAAAIAAFQSGGLGAVLGAYFLLTTSYSWRVKQIALMDVFFLAGLYTIRLIAGQAATGIALSTWLLAFSMFIFLSLALVKRFTELHGLRLQNKTEAKGRGYQAADLELVSMLGLATGCVAVLIMALYVTSKEVIDLYQRPALLLCVCPLFLYWIARIWLLAHRGRMHDDPIVFALKDRVSYCVVALIFFVIWLATIHF